MDSSATPPPAGAVTGTCDICGSPARVTVLVGYDGGRPVRRQRCLMCADLPMPLNPHVRRAPRGRPLLGATALIMLGAWIGLAGLLADPVLSFGTRQLGTREVLTLLGALLFVVLGSIFRVGAVAIVGALAAVSALAISFLQITETPGFGWKQRAALLLGLALLATGVALSSLRPRAKH